MRYFNIKIESGIFERLQFKPSSHLTKWRSSHFSITFGNNHQTFHLEYWRNQL